MPNILIYRHRLFKPSEVFIQKQAEALRQFSPVFMGQKVEGEVPEGRDVHTLDKTNNIEDCIALARYALIRNPGMFIKILHSKKIALIHAHFAVEGVYALKLAEAINVPLVTTFHGYDATTSTGSLLRSGKPSWINYVFFRRELAQKGNLFICVSNYIRERVIQMRFPEERTITHYIGVDTQSIYPFKISRKEKIVLHVARLTEKKGTRYLLNAFKKIVKKDADAQLIIIGDGPLRKGLEQLSQTLGIENRVCFLGMQSHDSVLEWMAKASVVSLPSITARSGDSEGLPIVLLEAAAMGVPAVATRHSGIPEALEDGRTGLMVPERSAEVLADRLIYLLQNDTVREEMGMAARRMVETKFDLTSQTFKLEALYEALL